MKKWAIGVIMVSFLFISSSSSFAMLRKDMEVVKGKIVSTNPGKSELTVNNSSTGKDMTFTVKRGIDSTLVVGATVTVIFKKGTNYATSVTVPRRGKY